MNKLRAHLKKMGLTSIDKTLDRFILYQEFLREYNKKVNLVSDKSLEEIETRHFIDSLAFLITHNCGEADLATSEACGDITSVAKNNSSNNYELCLMKNILDIGSGAGFPSIPLALVFEALSLPHSFTLVDSVRKKTDFLRILIEKLSLKNADVIHSRVEDLAHLKDSFDLVVSRATAPLPTLLEYSLPFLQINGRLVAYKGVSADEEISASTSALKTLGGRVEKIIPYSLEEKKNDETLKLVFIKKYAATPPPYPRGQNKPRIKPL